MKKKGSHVGVVLSFVVFVTFLLFIFTTLQPLTQTNQKRDILIDYLKDTIRQEVSSNLTKITVSGVEDSKQFLKIKPSEGVDYTDKFVVAKNNEFKDLSIKKEGGDLFVEKGGNTGLFYIYLSPENITGKFFNTLPGGANAVEEVNISLYQEKVYIFESKILDFINETMEYYPVVKDELDVSAGNEFGLVFENAHGIIEGTEEQDVQSDIYVDRIPVEYVNSNASVLHGFLSIKVW